MWPGYCVGMRNGSFLRTLRTTPTRRLVAVGLALVAIAVTGTTIALAASGGGPVPPAKPLPQAIRSALLAPSVAGVSADIRFTNHLVDAASLPGSDPLLTGAHGRLWVSGDHMLRLELQSNQGDAQVLSDGRTISVYDASQNTVYRAKLPAKAGGSSTDKAEAPPSLAQIEAKLAELTRHTTLSGADPTNVAGQPAYNVRVSPRHDGGLLGRAELAWDATHGVPLRVAVYATGKSSPVLELEATNISYSSVPASTFDVSPPKGTKVVDLSPNVADRARGGQERKPVTGVAAVGKAVPFSLTAPPTLAGLPRQGVHLIDHGGEPAALVVYGKGLGGVAVLEQKADPAEKAKASTGGRDHQSALPSVSINGATGQELDTALGSLIRFSRAGVAYTVVGSVPPAAAEAAARGL